MAACNYRSWPSSRPRQASYNGGFSRRHAGGLPHSPARPVLWPAMPEQDAEPMEAERLNQLTYLIADLRKRLGELRGYL